MASSISACQVVKKIARLFKLGFFSKFEMFTFVSNNEGLSDNN